MTTIRFQSAVSRMVIEPEFCEAIAAGDALPRALTDLERRRLRALARHRGMGITRKLHTGFRLNKILGRTPLCRILLGEARMVQELRRFWRAHPPTTFYYLHEATLFCEYLTKRCADDLTVPYLADVAAFEHAELKLRATRAPDDPGFEAVAFEYDPTKLFTALRANTIPTHLPHAPCVLIGTIDSQRCVQWHTMSAAAWRVWQANQNQSAS